MAQILLGDFGHIVAANTRGAVRTDNTALADGTWAIIISKAATNSGFDDFDVGDLYYQNGSTKPTLGSGDSYRIIRNIDSETDKAANDPSLLFAKSWQLEFARNQIDTTVLTDKQSTAIFGRPTISGTLGGILITDDDEMDKVIQRFVKSYKIGSSIEVLDIDTEPLAFLGYTLKKSAGKEFIEAYWMPAVDIGTLTVGAEVGGITEFSVPITLASTKEGKSIKRYAINLS